RSRPSPIVRAPADPRPVPARPGPAYPPAPIAGNGDGRFGTAETCLSAVPPTALPSAKSITRPPPLGECRATDDRAVCVASSARPTVGATPTAHRSVPYLPVCP